MKKKYYADIQGKREFYAFPPIATYFAAGFYPEHTPAGWAFVHHHSGLIPLYKISGERYCRPEYAGKEMRQLTSFKP